MSSYSTVSLVFMGVSMVLTSLLILFGNTLIIVIYKRNRSLQTAPNYFILSLAVADILIALVGVGSYTLILLVGKWPFNYTSCIAWLCIDHWSCTASAWTVMAIASDRFLAICYPIKRRNLQTKKNVKVAIGVIWSATFLIWVPLIVIYSYLSEGQNFPDDDCYVQFFSRNAWTTLFTALCSYYLPLLVIVVLYTAIVKKLVQRARQKEHRSASSVSIIDDTHFDTPYDASSPSTGQINMGDQSTVEKSQGNTLGIDGPNVCTEEVNDDKCNVESKAKTLPGLNTMEKIECRLEDRMSNVNKNTQQQHPPQHHKQTAATSRGVKLLLFVTVAFAVTWMPYYIMCILLSLDVNRSDIPMSVWQFCYIFGWLNSLLNPVCYAFGNKKFKKGFKEILCSCNRTRNSTL